MGLFSHIFGSSGSDKADKMRQQAYDAFASIQTPELQSLQVQLDKYVQQGVLTPEQAESELLGSNAFDSIRTDPSLGAAQHQALDALQQVGNSGGLTAVDKAQLQDITDQQNADAQGRRGAILSNAKERGVGGSGLEMADSLMNEQNAANRASRQGTDVAATAQQRALQALVAGGNMAGGMEAQQYGEQAQQAGAQNAIDKFNAQTMNTTNMFNVQNANAAQEQNLAEKQRVADSNTQTSNQNQVYNANANQTLYQDELGKASGEAGVFGNWADSAQKQKNMETGADLALIGGAIKTGAKAFAPQKSAGEDDSQGGFSRGGKVPGKAPEAGDSPANDTVDAKLSPGEVVVPRSAMSDEQEFEQFMAQFKPQKKAKPLRPEEAALADLHKRVRSLEGGK